MANKVFILGAGASRHAGAPLMWDFLDRARDLHAPKTMLPEWDEHFVRVFRAISALQSVHSKSSLDIRNLESVFTTFEMAKNIGRLGDLEKDDVEKCVDSLRALIFYTLDQCVRFSISNDTGDVVAPSAYRKFAECIRGSIRDHITVITFNYDVALDVALANEDLDVSYGLESLSQGPERVINLLKLHGSINWGLTTHSKPKIVFCPPRKLGPVNLMPKKPNFNAPLNLIDRLKPLIREHQGEDIQNLPVIVPPGLFKADYQASLSGVWRSAADALQNAHEIFVFGYSLPDTDFFFQNLYALGTVGENLLRKFYVFDPSRAVETRFEKLLGPGAQSVFDFTEATFEDGDPQMNVNVYTGTSFLQPPRLDGKDPHNFFGSLSSPSKG